MELPDDYKSVDLPAWIAGRPILDEKGFTPPPDRQRYSFDTIRGTIADEAIDHASGSRMRIVNWQYDTQAWANWWIDTL